MSDVSPVGLDARISAVPAPDRQRAGRRPASLRLGPRCSGLALTSWIRDQRRMEKRAGARRWARFDYSADWKRRAWRTEAHWTRGRNRSVHRLPRVIRPPSTPTPHRRGVMGDFCQKTHCRHFQPDSVEMDRRQEADPATASFRLRWTPATGRGLLGSRRSVFWILNLSVGLPFTDLKARARGVCLYSSCTCCVARTCRGVLEASLGEDFFEGSLPIVKKVSK